MQMEGGIYASLSTISSNTVSNNAVISANNAYGGGIFRARKHTLNGNTISGNSVDVGTFMQPGTGFGGGVYANGGIVDLQYDIE